MHTFCTELSGSQQAAVTVTLSFHSPSTSSCARKHSTYTRLHQQLVRPSTYLHVDGQHHCQAPHAEVQEQPQACNTGDPKGARAACLSYGVVERRSTLMNLHLALLHMETTYGQACWGPGRCQAGPVTHGSLP